MYFRTCGTLLLLYTLLECDWLWGVAPITAPPGPGPPSNWGQVYGRLTVRVGLDVALFSLTGQMTNGTGGTRPLDFYKKVNLDEGDEAVLAALTDGSPFPIVTALDYFKLQDTPYWGLRLRAAGRIADFFLRSAFVVWLLYNVVRVLIKPSSEFLLACTGLLTLCAVACYHSFLVSQRQMAIPMENSLLVMEYGYAFYLASVFGASCVLVASWRNIVSTPSCHMRHTWPWGSNVPSFSIRHFG